LPIGLALPISFTPRAVFEWFQTSNRRLIAHRIDIPALLLNGVKPIVFRSIIPGIIVIHRLFKLVTAAIIRIHIKSGTLYCSWTIGLFLPDYLWANQSGKKTTPTYADFWFSTGTNSLYINLFTDFNSRGKEALVRKEIAIHIANCRDRILGNVCNPQKQKGRLTTKKMAEGWKVKWK
jgi:hypothetical protein